MIDIHKSEWCDKLHDMHDWGPWIDLSAWFGMPKEQRRYCNRCHRREEREIYVENG